MKIFKHVIRKINKRFFIKKWKSNLIVFAIVLMNLVYANAQIPGVTVNVNQLDIAANLWRLEDILNSVTIEYDGEESLVICVAGTITNSEGSYVCVKGNNYNLSPASYPQVLLPGGFINPETISSDGAFEKTIKDFARRTGSLPPGLYTICVEVYPVDECNCDFEGNCVEQEIFSPSPPELIYPEDESEISEELPLFSWLPPMPSYGMELYTLQIVEINDGQSPIEAMEVNPHWFFKDDISYNSFQLSIAEREFVSGQRYAWSISASIGTKGGKGNAAIVESQVRSFKYNKMNNSLINLLDPNFNEACKIIKQYFPQKEDTKIYGVIDPIPVGATIEPEILSDIENSFQKDTVKYESYLFIIDDEPGARFGHPVHYALLNTDLSLNTIKIYDANWWPVIRHSYYTFEVAGSANDIELLHKVATEEGSSFDSDDIEGAIIDVIQCPNLALIIDGGDKDRMSTPSEQKKEGAIKVQSMKEYFENEKYRTLLFSQTKTENALPVNNEKKTATDKIIKELQKINKIYNLDCCNTTKTRELSIYISANSIRDSTFFLVYSPDGKGGNEIIDYRKCILEPLKSFPSCVKIKLYVADCFTGSKQVEDRMLDYLMDIGEDNLTIIYKKTQNK